MFQFEPVPQPGNKWILSKLGQKVDPTNVILNGSQHQHGRITYCITFLLKAFNFSLILHSP